MRPKSKTRATAVPVAAPAAPALHPMLSALRESRWLYALVSLLLLTPCYWQSRIQAGDLSSHIYNAWLGQSIQTKHLQGLAVMGQTTNVLFDLMLNGLMSLVGAGAAQRIAVSLAVLVFIWGAFAFVRAVAGRNPWHVMPCIAMLAYGWVFHMGFFNFYLSLGLCFWAMALLWAPNSRRIAAAAPLLMVAYVAHGLPVLWTGCLVAYVFLARRLSEKLRVYVIAGAVAAMVILHVAIGGMMTMRWSAQQITLTTGLDQMWVFDQKYYAVMVGLLLIWVWMFLNLMRRSSARGVMSSVTFQLCLISAAGVFILPTTVLIPGYRHALAYIAERMSLGVGICICALLASAQPRRFERWALAMVAVLFFGFLYRDERMLNSFEDSMQQTVAALPAGQRVISAVDDPDLRVNALAHMIDRACVGHCYSYANYEPSTAQFRVRATAENPYVAYTYEDSWLLQVGAYVVKDRDLPMYQVDMDGRGRMVLKSLRPGVPAGSTIWKVLESPL